MYIIIWFYSYICIAMWGGETMYMDDENVKLIKILLYYIILWYDIMLINVDFWIRQVIYIYINNGDVIRPRCIVLRGW